MSGISTGTGLFSGIDTQSIIEQLLAVEARPRLLMQRRAATLQLQQSAILDINSRLNALKSAASAFRTGFTFRQKSATSSDSDVLSATASSTAQIGSYQFLVDRLVTSQQLLTDGFADSDISGIGIDQLTFESADARLDRDMELAELNGGDGVSRGKVVITQGTASATIDLTKAVTVSDVLNAINAATGVSVTATVSDAGIVLESDSAFTVSNAVGYDTATDLGIAGASADVGGTQTIQSGDLYVLGAGTSLSSLNDGNGVHMTDTIGQNRYDFTITLDDGVNPPTQVNVNVGDVYDAEANKLEGRATTVGKVISRINAALSAAGVTDLAAAIGADGARIDFSNATGMDLTIAEHDGTTARDLGILIESPTAASTVSGRRVIADLNGTLAHTLNGGQGVSGDGQLSITARDGTVLTIDLTGAETVREILDAIESASGNNGKIVASLNNAGSGLSIADTTGGVLNLIVTGDAADALGIATDPAGVEEDSVRGLSAQHAYVTEALLLEDFNAGKGVGTGEFTITDGNGRARTINIGSDTKNIFQLVSEINKQLKNGNLNAQVRINDRGDGLIVEEKDGQPEATGKIRVKDESGAVARNLGISGEAAGTGDENVIDGSLEHTVELELTDTLADVARKINEEGVGVSATVFNDGSAAAPFRLSLTSTSSGRAGRFVLDTHGFDLGADTIEAGEDARVFYGSSDPARAVLLTSSSNTLDRVLTGVTIDLKSVSTEPVTVAVSRDTAKMETQIDAFVKAFNTVIERIDHQSRFIEETSERGPLLGDSTAQQLRARLYSVVQSEGIGLSGSFRNLTQIGITVGEGGALTLDRDRLREAMEQDFDAVADLFTKRTLVAKDEFVEIDDGIFVRNTDDEDHFSELGVAGLIEELAKDYTDVVDGLLTTRNQSINTQIEQQQDRIEAFTARLDNRRLILERQFLAMEQAIALLSTQQGALSGIAPLTG
ncbi:MAG: flagellar filament capping protein FliD [Phycisphaeraceae bacterium]|nr:flagellar filament capping protein FliD [Phycisphaeraceae bacterium]